MTTRRARKVSALVVEGVHVGSDHSHRDPVRESGDQSRQRPRRDSVRKPTAAPPAGLMALQAGAGNAAVVQMLRRAGRARAEEEHQHTAECGHQPDAWPAVQRSAVHDVLRRPGRPLNEATRSDMENRLGADFSDVRVHSDAAAKASAAEVGARAYTSGSHIVLGEGGGDKHTLAHELTHVIQQRQGPVAGTDNGAGLKVSDPSDRYEREAEATARKVMSAPGHTGSAEARGESSVAAGDRIQRMPEQENEEEDWETAVDYVDKAYPGMKLKKRQDLMDEPEAAKRYVDIYEVVGTGSLVIWDGDDLKYIQYDPRLEGYEAALTDGDLTRQANLKGMYEPSSDSTYHYFAGYNDVRPGVKLESCKEFSAETIGYGTVVEVRIEAILKEVGSVRPDVGVGDPKDARRSQSMDIAMDRGAALPPVAIAINPDGTRPDMRQGNHRIHAAKKAGHAYVPVVFHKS